METDMEKQNKSVAWEEGNDFIGFMTRMIFNSYHSDNGLLGI